MQVTIQPAERGSAYRVTDAQAEAGGSAQMALKDDTPLALKLPQLSTLDQDKIVFSYDEEADLLVVHFFRSRA